MHLVHSFYSSPFLINKNHGGWIDDVSYWSSWVLSFQCAKKHYPIHLVTDSFGKKILIDKLGLAYDEVSLAFDEMPLLPPDLWAFGKLYAYSIQKKPFIHIDADVYLWDKLPSYIENANLLGQEFEDFSQNQYPLYREILNQISDFTPSFAKGFQAINAGIFGGKEISFFQDLWDLSYTFYKENKNKFSPLFRLGWLNLLCEQYFSVGLSTQKNLVFTPLRSPNQTWNNVFSHTRYTHVLANSKILTSKSITYVIKEDYPDFFEKINHITK